MTNNNKFKYNKNRAAIHSNKHVLVFVIYYAFTTMQISRMKVIFILEEEIMKIKSIRLINNRMRKYEVIQIKILRQNNGKLFKLNSNDFLLIFKL